MNVIITKNYQEMSNKAAEFIKDIIKSKQEVVLGLATGSTPEGTYAKLVKFYEDKQLSFKGVTSFNLDEYIGLEGTHEKSYRYFMNKHLFDKTDIDKKNTFVPSGTGNVQDNISNFEKLLSEKGPVSLQVLGIGTNAHIGFNEPGTSFNSRTSEVNLTKATIDANSRYFASKDEVPKTAISMGIDTIMDAEAIILLASGKNKAEAIKNTIEGPLTESVPSSILQKHKNVTIIIDEDAASLLTRK